jgi:hypothetical protein
MRTLEEYDTTKETLYDMHDELKKRRCKATAKIVENVLEAWVQIEKDIDWKDRLAREGKIPA